MIVTVSRQRSDSLNISALFDVFVNGSHPVDRFRGHEVPT